MKNYFLILLLTFNAVQTSAAAKKSSKSAKEESSDALHIETINNSALHLSIDRSHANSESPWSIDNDRDRTQLGIVLPGGVIATSAKAVVGATLIEYQIPKSSDFKPLEIEYIDYEYGIAFLKARETDNFVPLELGEDLPLNTETWLIYSKGRSQLARSPARLQEVTWSRSATGFLSLPHYLMRTQQKHLGQMEPIIRGRSLVAVTVGQDDDNVYALPSSILKVSLDRARSARQGMIAFPGKLGIEHDTLTQSHFRRFLNLKADQNGVVVREVQSEIPKTSELEVNDVLLEIDGKKIDRRGNILHELWGNLPFASALVGKKAGEKVKVTLSRRGEIMEKEVELKAHDSSKFLVPVIADQNQPPYIIVGGLLFRELDFTFIESFGRDWLKKAPPELLEKWYYENGPRTNQQRVIMMQRVLADNYNQGYERDEGLILEKVNDQPCRNINDLKLILKASALTANGEAFYKFTFANGGGDIILGKKDLEAAHKRIARSYNIPEGKAFF